MDLVSRIKYPHDGGLLVVARIFAFEKVFLNIALENGSIQQQLVLVNGGNDLL